ncbi:MAG: DUF4097 domain-containing protein [Pirellulales bacterium]|nr:DUF4097 domain-containing protein [Pirellulales bacterium]
MCRTKHHACSRSRRHGGGLFRLLLFVGLAVWVVKGCALRPFHNERYDTIELSASGLTNLEVKSLHGEIRIEGDTAPHAAVRVMATVHAQASSQEAVQEALDAVEVITPISDDGRMLRLDWRWRDGHQRSVSVWVDYHVELPALVAVHLQTVNGQLEVNDMLAPAKLSSQNGEINVRGVRQRLDASTQNGQINVVTAAPDVHIESQNGTLDVVLLAPGPVQGEINTHNGAVEVGFGPQTACDVQCQTHNGAIDDDLELEGKKRKNRSLTGRVHGGGSELSITTHNGSITLDESDKELDEPAIDDALPKPATGQGASVPDVQSVEDTVEAVVERVAEQVERAADAVEARVEEIERHLETSIDTIQPITPAPPAAPSPPASPTAPAEPAAPTPPAPPQTPVAPMPPQAPEAPPTSEQTQPPSSFEAFWRAAGRLFAREKAN